VQYFPSYEIVSHVASFGQYLQSDRREISERGVGHVMQCFFEAFYPDVQRHEMAASAVSQNAMQLLTEKRPDMERLLQANCEEMFNTPTGR
jgi:hypothetical protein